MKILLTTLNSKYIHSNLALRYLYACAGEHRRIIDIQEFTINNDDDYIFAELLKKNYDLVCFSCYIWNMGRTAYLAENLKKARPEIKILFGGPEVSYDVIEFMSKHKFIDYLIQGEGEMPFKELIDNLAEGKNDFERIKSLTYRLNGKIYVNPVAMPVDFEQIPFPYLNLATEDDKVVYYESTRGCPYNCSYCLSSIDKRVRALPLERVKTDLSYFIYKRVKQVKFIDRTFNWDKKRAVEILKYLMVSDNGFTNFHFEICADIIDEELHYISSKAREGLFQFEIGVQSTNINTIAACNRSSNFELISNNVKRIIEKGNIHVHLDLIAGLPFEDYKSFKKSFNDVYKLGSDHLQLGFLKMLKGTPIRNTVKEHGYIYRDKAPYEVISNNYISSMELIRLKKIENVLDLYYNRGGFSSTIEYAISCLANSPFEFYEELADYYYLKGFQHKSHKKEDLYRIFFMYACWKQRFIPNIQDKVKELLYADMKKTLNPEAIKKFERKGWEIL